jgi:hypothetical protein
MIAQVESQKRGRSAIPAAGIVRSRCEHDLGKHHFLTDVMRAPRIEGIKKIPRCQKLLFKREQ